MLNTLEKNITKISPPARMSYHPGYNKQVQRNHEIHNRSGEIISAEVLNLLLNQTNDLVTVLNSNGNIIFVSDSVEKILGFKKEERIGQNAFLMVHKDDLPRVYNDFLNLLNSSGTSAISSFRYLRSDGNYIFLEASGTGVIDQYKNKYIIIISRDVTSRIESEKNLTRLRAAVEQSSNTVVITDVNGNIEYVNKKFTDLTGYSKEEAIGATPALLRSESTSDDTYKELWSTILCGNVWQGELKNKKSSGEYYWERIKITPVVDYNDRITGFIALKDDITNEKKINEKLKESLSEKEKMLIENEIILKEKEMLLREKEIMLKEIHHRVKNNLQIVISLLNLQATTVDDIKLKNQLAISQNRVRSMALIHQHLYRSADLARINMEDYLLSLSGQLLASYAEIKDKVNIKVYSQNVYFCIETAVPFGLLVNELISNSLKHGFPGNMEGTIDIKLKVHENEKYQLEYSDNGVGIPLNIINGHVVSFGMNLIEMLVSQLEGNIELGSRAGTKYIINFRGSNYQTRL